jgi:Zn-finger nucleic acid-binding protein
MDRHPYLGPGNVVIDTCSTCDLIWLDHGELTEMVDAPGSDRGVPLAEQGADEVAREEEDEVIRVRDGRLEIDVSRLFGRLFG